jgi:hypothetical protein
VINSLQDATVVGAATEAGHALTVAYNRKVQKVGGLPPRGHEVAVREVKKLSAALARHRGD